MPKYYAETVNFKLVIDKDSPEEAAKALIGINPEIVYDVMKSNTTMFIFINEKGFGAEYRTDMMFDIIEMVHKMGPSGGK